MNTFGLMGKTVLLTIVSVFALLAGSPCVRAQVPPELESFQQAAGERSILYRGRQGAKYNVLANGHQYWSKPEFESGDITFEDRFYHNVALNIDAVEQRALVKLANSPFVVALTPDLTPSFTIGESRFVGIGPGENLPAGFYEEFGDGPEHVYKHVYKVVDTNTQNGNGDAIGYYDEHYRSNYTRHFAIHRVYYFRDAEGHVTRFRSRNALIRKFPDRKRQIRQAVNAARQQPAGLGFDDFCKLVLNTAAR